MRPRCNRRRKNEKFCSTRKQLVCDKRKPVSKSNRSDQTPASTMKTLLTISLCSLALALTSLAQSPPPAQARPAAPGTNPAAQAPGNPAAAAQAPATNVPPGQAAAPGQPAAAGQPAAPGAPAAMSPAALALLTTPMGAPLDFAPYVPAVLVAGLASRALLGPVVDHRHTAS